MSTVRSPVAAYAPSAKSAVGTACGDASRVWFTLLEGTLSETFHPHPDSVRLRRVRFVVTGPGGWIWQSTAPPQQIAPFRAGVPGFRVTHVTELFELSTEYLTDPVRDALLVRCTFQTTAGPEHRLRLFVLAEPSAEDGRGTIMETGVDKLLVAESCGVALAMASSAGYGHACVDRVGAWDPVSDLRAHGRLMGEIQSVEGGPIILAGEIPLEPPRELVLAIGFADTCIGAAHHARASLLRNFAEVRAEFERGWISFQEEALELGCHASDGGRLYRASTAVLRTHETRVFPGAIVAGLSVPWGEVRQRDGLGGYHVIWTRDLVQTVGALFAAGIHELGRRALGYLAVTQERDGHWPQNMWADGRPNWSAVQLDQAAFPVLLADSAARHEILSSAEIERIWPCLQRALHFLVSHGPATPQDRWENRGGYSVYTLAVSICALLAGARLAEAYGEDALAFRLTATADAWNARIEEWTYVTGTRLARECGVGGYYARLRPMRDDDAQSWRDVTSPDALALVRFGLRAADDPRILSTIEVIDKTLKVQTPYGTAWRRYNGDTYGETPDGEAWNPEQTDGRGRAWPLLTGERAHYEIAAGKFARAGQLTSDLERFANSQQMLSEQVWDAPDLRDRGLVFGRPTGSVMPLVWAHAEYIKLLRSLRDRAVFDQPPWARERYLERPHQVGG
jgi:glucoamylase